MYNMVPRKVLSLIRANFFDDLHLSPIIQLLLIIKDNYLYRVCVGKHVRHISYSPDYVGVFIQDSTNNDSLGNVLFVSCFVLFLSLLARLAGTVRGDEEASFGGDVSDRFKSVFDVL